MQALAGKHEYCGALLQRGYQQVGGGLFSKVYSKPALNYVIKVAEIDQWADYAVWATKEGYAGSFAPKVHSLKFHKGFYVAIIEKLVCTMNEVHGNTVSDQTNLRNAMRRWMTWARPRDGDIELPSELQEFCQKCVYQGFNTDLHGGNFMIRSDGQLVLIDPAGNYSSPGSRIKRGVVIPEMQ